MSNLDKYILLLKQKQEEKKIQESKTQELTESTKVDEQILNVLSTIKEILDKILINQEKTMEYTCKCKFKLAM